MPCTRFFRATTRQFPKRVSCRRCNAVLQRLHCAASSSSYIAVHDTCSLLFQRHLSAQHFKRTIDARFAMVIAWFSVIAFSGNHSGDASSCVSRRSSWSIRRLRRTIASNVNLPEISYDVNTHSTAEAAAARVEGDDNSLQLSVLEGTGWRRESHDSSMSYEPW